MIRYLKTSLYLFVFVWRPHTVKYFSTFKAAIHKSFIRLSKIHSIAFKFSNLLKIMHDVKRIVYLDLVFSVVEDHITIIIQRFIILFQYTNDYIFWSKMQIGRTLLFDIFWHDNFMYDALSCLTIDIYVLTSITILFL